MEKSKELSLFDRGLKKSEIFSMAVNAFENVLETGNFLQSAEALSAMENFIKQLKDNDNFKSYIRDEIAKHPGGFVSTSGAKIELAETGVEYDFSNCNDAILIDLEEKALYEKIKVDTRKKFLKNVPLAGLEIVDKESGEVTTIYPPVKTSQSSYKVTLSK